jgi:putative acetyltransferase
VSVAIRAEAQSDATAIRRVLAQAFPSDAEARLVDALRKRAQPQISLVAETPHDGVVGQILLTAVEIPSLARTVGLAPMSVLPERQRRGVGSALVKAGLSACRAAGFRAVVVLGHVDYYPRFGFRPAWDFGLYYKTPGALPAFMALELEPNALQGAGGEVRYYAAFDEALESP